MPAPLPLPACCSAPVADWTLPQGLPGLHLHSCRFDPARFAADDFARCALEPPPGIATAVHKRQSEFLAGRLCAASALRALCGQASYPPRGADNAPRWPQGSLGSITHSHGWAAALVGTQEAWRGLGLDAERLLDASRAERLAAEILTTDELVRFRRLPEEERGPHLTLCFSLKESLFKALYPLTLTRFYFHDAELLEMDHDSARLRLLIDLHPDWRTGTELDGQFALFDNKVLSLVAVAA